MGFDGRLSCPSAVLCELLPLDGVGLAELCGATTVLGAIDAGWEAGVTFGDVEGGELATTMDEKDIFGTSGLGARPASAGVATVVGI